MFSQITSTALMTEANEWFGIIAPLLLVGLALAVASRVANFFRSLF